MINAISAFNVNAYAYLGRVGSVQPSAPVSRSVPDNTPEDDQSSSSSAGNTTLGSDVVTLSSSLLLALQAETAPNVSLPSSSNSGYGAYNSAQATESSNISSEAISGGNSILA